MKARKDLSASLRRALDRGGLYLEQGQAFLKTRWRDFLFTLLVAVGLVLYLARPERAAQWVATGRWWEGLLHYPGLEERAARFEGEPILRPPADYGQSGLTALASFDGALEYLGADTAVTWGQDGVAHLWLLTYWHCPAAACDFRVRYTWGRSGPGMALAVHNLARPELRSGDYVVDHLLLPEAAVEGVVAVQVDGGGPPLPVVSPILQVEEGVRLYIWQK
jgi:hypothetical protein